MRFIYLFFEYSKSKYTDEGGKVGQVESLKHDEILEFKKEWVLL